jgi:Lon-like ATP-dependent protease
LKNSPFQNQFAQITNLYQSGNDNSALTVVVYPHRRIKLTEIVHPVSEIASPPTKEPTNASTADSTSKTPATETASTSNASPSSTDTSTAGPSETSSSIPLFPSPDEAATKTNETFGYSELNQHLSQHAVSVVNVVNLVEQPYNHEESWIRAATSEVLNTLKEISQINPLLRDQIITFSIHTSGQAFMDPSRLADFAAAVSAGESGELQSILEALSIEDRLHKALVVLKKELANAKLQQEISKEVDKKINRQQQEYFLREQLKGIKKELGMESDGKDKLVDKFKERAKTLVIPEAAKKVFDEASIVYSFFSSKNHNL